MGQEHLRYVTQAEMNGAVINKYRPILRAVVVTIILLHALMTIHFAANWSWICVAFVKNGQSFWTVYLSLHGRSPEAAYWVMCITSSIGLILTDLYTVCAIPLPGYYSHQLTAISTFDPRFGAAGWFWGNAGLLFCFQYFP